MNRETTRLKCSCTDVTALLSLGSLLSCVVLYQLEVKFHAFVCLKHMEEKLIRVFFFIFKWEQHYSATNSTGATQHWSANHRPRLQQRSQSVGFFSGHGWVCCTVTFDQANKNNSAIYTLRLELQYIDVAAPIILWVPTCLHFIPLSRHLTVLLLWCCIPKLYWGKFRGQMCMYLLPKWDVIMIIIKVSPVHVN